MQAKWQDIDKHFSESGAGISVASFDEKMLRTPSSPVLISLPSPRSIIIGAFPYYFGEDSRNLSKYAVCRDYHIYVGDLLKRICEELKDEYKDNYFLPFVDSSLVKEVYTAAVAGLGIIGRNGLLITPEYGSYVFIGGILTDLEIDDIISQPVQYCENCGKCQLACPGGALGDSFVRLKCLSNITQKRGELTEAEQKMIIASGTVWGCDICQDICPHNKNVRKTEIPWFSENLLKELLPEDLEDLDEAAFKEKYKDRAFTWRGIDVLKRNLKIQRDRNTENQ